MKVCIVAKMVSFRCFLSVAIAKGWELHHMDVNNAFLHGDLDKEVFMTLPPGFRTSTPNKVCKLSKSLYGLKLAPRQWFAKLSSKLLEYGYIRSWIWLYQILCRLFSIYLSEG